MCAVHCLPAKFSLNPNFKKFAIQLFQAFKWSVLRSPLYVTLSVYFVLSIYVWSSSKWLFARIAFDGMSLNRPDIQKWGVAISNETKVFFKCCWHPLINFIYSFYMLFNDLTSFIYRQSSVKTPS